MRYRLKEIRTERGMSIAELARRSGVSRGTIIRLESEDKVETTVGTLNAIAIALNTTMEALLCPQSATC